MEELLQILNETQILFAYHHFAEGESPEPPFICYLLPGSNNFSADGKVYYKINEVHIELYTDWCKYVHTLEKPSKIKENRHSNTLKYAILYAKFFENP